VTLDLGSRPLKFRAVDAPDLECIEQEVEQRVYVLRVEARSRTGNQLVSREVPFEVIGTAGRAMTD
jgi:hypothetical protein